MYGLRIFDTNCKVGYHGKFLRAKINTRKVGMKIIM